MKVERDDDGLRKKEEEGVESEVGWRRGGKEKRGDGGETGEEGKEEEKEGEEGVRHWREDGWWLEGEREKAAGLCISRQGGGHDEEEYRTEADCV